MPLTNVTLATIIPNRYSAATSLELARAITDVCSPTDPVTFASSGIYIFWDTATQQILYIGLAVDLGLRFRQHNGLVDCDISSCKRTKIVDHFERHPYLGYSVLAQSPLDQAMCSAWTQSLPEDLHLFADEFSWIGKVQAVKVYNSPLVKALRWMEGLLIRAYIKKCRRGPLWNRNSGAQISYTGRQLALAVDILNAAVCVESAAKPQVSRCSLIELSSNPNFAAFESYLHGVRMIAGTGSSLSAAAKQIPDMGGYWQRMAETGYFRKNLQL